MPFRQGAPHGLYQGEEGTGLDTASGRSRRCSDEHQKRQGEQSRVGEGAQRIGGKACGTGRYAVEKGSQPGHVVGELENHGSDHDQENTGCNDYLRMKRQLPEMKAVLQHVQDYQETDTSEDNQTAGRQVQQYVVPVRNQVLQAAQHIEAGVIEGRDGVEDTVAQGVKGRIVLNKYEEA